MNKHKIVIILFFMGLFLFFISSVNATEQIKNGNFSSYYSCSMNWDELGCPYNWTVSNPYYSVVRPSGYIDSMMLLWAGGYMTQDVDFTNTDNLNFYAKIQPLRYVQIYIDDVFIEEFELTNDWVNYNVDVSAYSGIKTLKFKSKEFYVYVDEISLATPDISEISFYPEQTNITPTHINFSINEDDEDTEYGLFIYRNVSNISSYIDYVGWFYDEIGSAPLDIMDYGANCTYYAKLWGVHVGDIATCEREYIFNGSIDPFPTPDPTPNITALPTYTPQPTPTGYPNQSLINNSLNSSWASAWFNLVENTISGFFLPVYNFWGWILYPVNLLHDILADFSNQMSIFFDEASNKIVIATEILNTIFLYIPDKIVNLIGYYLLWLCIILVFKGDT